MIAVSRFSALIAGAAIALGPALAQAQQTPGPNNGGNYPYPMGPWMMDWAGGGWSMMIFGPLFMILVLVVVIVAAVLIVRAIGGTTWLGPPPLGHRALDILKERYARGEIDKNEFEERRRTLGE
ncbi:MAG: SHOCT domain-containing protein [Roseiarcus sp.]|jgi:putative membrane protein